MSVRDLIMAAAGAAPGVEPYFFAGNGGNINAYPIDRATGTLGTAKTPAVQPGGSRYIAVSPDGKYIAVASESSGPVVYPWTSSGFGSPIKYASWGTTVCYGVAFSPDSKNLIATKISGASQTIGNFAIGASSLNLVEFIYPGGAHIGYGAQFSPSGNAILFTQPSGASGSGNIAVAYAWNQSTNTFGAKYPDPATKVVFASYSVYATSACFSPSGKTVAVQSAATPFIHAWAWDDATGFGAKYANPAVLPTSFGYGLRFSNMSNALFVAPGSSILTYAFSEASGFGSRKVTSGYAQYQIAIPSTGDFIAISSSTTPYARVARLTGNTIGVTTAVITTGALCRSVAFNF